MCLWRDAVFIVEAGFFRAHCTVWKRLNNAHCLYLHCGWGWGHLDRYRAPSSKLVQASTNTESIRIFHDPDYRQRNRARIGPLDTPLVHRSGIIEPTTDPSTQPHPRHSSGASTPRFKVRISTPAARPHLSPSITTTPTLAPAACPQHHTVKMPTQWVDWSKTTHSKDYRGSGSFATFLIIGRTLRPPRIHPFPSHDPFNPFPTPPSPSTSNLNLHPPTLVSH